MSVVLPVRDGGVYLAEAVDSILGQSLIALELIVVDDHSRDHAVARLPRGDARLRILPNPGEGIVAALNAGLRAARGRYIARMDADDVALAERLEVQLAYLEAHPGIGLAGGRVELFCAQPPGQGYRRYADWVNGLVRPEDIAREAFIECPLPHPTFFFRRELLEVLDGYHQGDWPEDYDWVLRARAAGIRLGKPEPVVLRWREHGGRLSRADPRYAPRAFMALKAHHLRAGWLAGREAIIWGAGPTGRLLHDALAAAGVTVTGFIDVHPRRAGGRKRGLPVSGVGEFRPVDGQAVLVAVGVPSARPPIRAFLERSGSVEGVDFLFAA